MIDYSIYGDYSRRKIRHKILNKIIANLGIKHNEKNVDAILVALEDVLEDDR